MLIAEESDRKQREKQKKGYPLKWGDHTLTRMQVGHAARRLNFQQKLMKKGRGHLIHVSDFVEEEHGCLIIWNTDGVIVKNAWCIIYPGANGDN